MAAIAAGGVGAQEPCLPVVDPPVADVFAVEASALDVAATLSWSAELELPPRAELVVRNASCGVVATLEVIPEPNDLIVETVTDVFRKASKHGLAYRIAIESDDGESLSLPFHFQVGLECPSIDVCTYQLLGGVFTDGIFVSGPLDRALDEIAGEPLDHVLANVIIRRPDLRGDVYAMAARLSGLDKEIHFSRPPSCACLMTTSLSSDEDLLLHEIDDVHELAASSGLIASVWLLYLGARTIEPPVIFDVAGRTTSRVAVRCYEVSAWEPIRVAIASAGSLRFRFPVLRECEIPCQAEIVHSVSFTLNLEALAQGDLFFPTLARAGTLARYSVDGAQLFQTLHAVAAASDPPNPPSDTISSYRPKLWIG